MGFGVLGVRNVAVVALRYNTHNQKRLSRLFSEVQLGDRALRWKSLNSRSFLAIATRPWPLACAVEWCARNVAVVAYIGLSCFRAVRFAHRRVSSLMVFYCAPCSRVMHLSMLLKLHAVV